MYLQRCGRILQVNDSGVISMPRGQFEGNCTWYLRAPESTNRFTLTFSDFMGFNTVTEWEMGSNETRCYSPVEVNFLSILFETFIFNPKYNLLSRTLLKLELYF